MKKQLLLIALLACMTPLISIAGLDHESSRPESVETTVEATIDIVPNLIYYAGKKDIIRQLTKLGIACKENTVLAEVEIKDSHENNLAIHGHKALGQNTLPRCLPLEILENNQKALTIDLGGRQVILQLEPVDGFYDKLKSSKHRFLKRPEYGLNEAERKFLEKKAVLKVTDAKMVTTPDSQGGNTYSLSKTYAHGANGFAGREEQSSGWKSWFGF